jgi:hypothetical protein
MNAAWSLAVRMPRTGVGSCVIDGSLMNLKITIRKIVVATTTKTADVAKCRAADAADHSIRIAVGRTRTAKMTTAISSTSR